MFVYFVFVYIYIISIANQLLFYKLNMDIIGEICFVNTIP